MKKKIIIITGLILFGCITLFHVQINMTNNEIKDVTIENAEVLADFEEARACAGSGDCAVEEDSICVWDNGGNCVCEYDEEPTCTSTVPCRGPC